MGDDSRRESPRRALATVRTRMSIGELLLRVAFVANAPTHRILGSRLGEVLLLRCRGVLLANISHMQFCKRPMFANTDKKTFSDIAVKVVGAFASNAP